jgi:hypothetical protein
MPAGNEEHSMNKLIDDLFLAHPRCAGQGYFEHLGFAWSVAATLASGAVAAFLHGLLPFLLQTTAGDAARSRCGL